MAETINDRAYILFTTKTQICYQDADLVGAAANTIESLVDFRSLQHDSGGQIVRLISE